MQKKGFTLIELLVVIGILAILTAAVVVVLNPAELLRQSRDAQRMSDMDALRGSINLFLSTVSSPTFASSGQFVTNTAGANFSGGIFTAGALTVNTSTLVTGTGWVPINFGLMSSTVGSAPLSALPIDPINDGNYAYAGAFNSPNLQYELDTRLESTKYASKMTPTANASLLLYQVGNNLSM